MKKKKQKRLNAGGGTMVAEPLEVRAGNGSGFALTLKERIATAVELRAPRESVRVGTTNPRKDFNLDDLLPDVKEHGIVSSLWARPIPQWKLLEPDLTSDQWRLVRVDGVPAPTGPAVGEPPRRAGDFIHEFPQENIAFMELNHRNEFQYELIAGERRYRCAVELGLPEVPLKVIDCTPEEAWKLQRIENFKRKDLAPLEEAQDYYDAVHSQRFGESVDASVQALAKEVGCHPSHIYRRMSLLKLSEPARKAFIAGDVDHCLAQEISAVPNEKAQEAILKMHAETPFSVRTIREHIELEYMTPLGEALFDTENESLVTIAKDCGSCPKRTGNMVEMFPHLKSRTHFCTDTKCFKLKTDADRELKLSAYREKGARVLTAKESKPLFPSWDPSQPKRDSGWALANTVPPEDKEERTLKQLAKAVGIAPAVCCNGNGKVVEVFELAPLTAKLLEEKVIKPPKANDKSRRHGTLGLGYEKAETEEDCVKRAIEEEVARRGRDRIVAALVAVIEKRGQKKMADLLRYLICNNRARFYMGPMLRRRGLDESDHGHEAAMKMRVPQLLAFLFEMTLLEYCGWQNDAIKAACREWNVDPKKLEKEIRGQVKEQFRLPSDGEEFEVPPELFNSMNETYSADRINDRENAIKEPFTFRGRRWIALSGGPGDVLEAYRVVPEAEFEGKTGGHELLNPENGYHGIKVTHGKQAFVLSRPEIKIKAKEAK